MLKKIMSGDRTYTAIPLALPIKYEPYGELFEDFYVVPVVKEDGSVQNHLVQSGKFYIRDYSNGENNYQDILIDPDTLEDVTDPINPIVVGIDLARDIDLTYCNGEYFVGGFNQC